MDKRTVDLTGRKVGEWTVLQFDGYNKRNAYWLCRCSCGFEKSVKAQYLIAGSSTKCQKCAKPKRETLTTFPNNFWSNLKNNALKRGITFGISKEDCFQLLEKQHFKCALSGLDLYMSKNASEHNEGKTTASLDRIDSSLPYIPENVQWIHKDINFMKHTFGQDYFLDLCEKITIHCRENLLVCKVRGCSDVV